MSALRHIHIARNTHAYIRIHTCTQSHAHMHGQRRYSILLARTHSPNFGGWYCPTANLKPHRRGEKTEVVGGERARMRKCKGREEGGRRALRLLPNLLPHPWMTAAGGSPTTLAGTRKSWCADLLSFKGMCLPVKSNVHLIWGIVCYINLCRCKVGKCVFVSAWHVFISCWLNLNRCVSSSPQPCLLLAMPTRGLEVVIVNFFESHLLPFNAQWSWDVSRIRSVFFPCCTLALP